MITITAKKDSSVLRIQRRLRLRPGGLAAATPGRPLPGAAPGGRTVARPVTGPVGPGDTGTAARPATAPPRRAWDQSYRGRGAPSAGTAGLTGGAVSSRVGTRALPEAVPTDAAARTGVAARANGREYVSSGYGSLP